MASSAAYTGRRPQPLVLSCVLLVCAWVACATTVPASPCSSVQVTMHVFSGLLDPSWRMTPQQLNNILLAVAAAAADTEAQPLPSAAWTSNFRLGYSGFSLRSECPGLLRLPLSTSTGDAALVDVRHAFVGNGELFLLGESGAVLAHVFIPSGVSEIERQLLELDVMSLAPELVLSHVKQRLVELPPAPVASADPLRFERLAAFGSNGNANCQPIVDIGPDTNGHPDDTPPYDPDVWNGNEHCQYDNNCYNYGTDVRTNTFAQPGRGSGHKWQANTCDAVITAAKFDGLAVANYSVGDTYPGPGHLVALVMWDDVNFHWYRLDTSGTWSNKHGGTEATDKDNDGRTIVDPKTASRSPYNTFCTYMAVIPSKVATSIN